ncbi:hypothetical protein M0805_004657 [Coniferiporia weirii]|nr:hypothetical protein M0805_004657 [Coniferiporia weirii]
MLVLALDVAACAYASYYLGSWLSSLWRKSNPGKLPYPPGPKGWPLVGNIFNIPDVGELEQAREWAQQYGDVAFFKALGKTYLLVNTYDAAVELFEKRGSNYSSRPENTLRELGGWSRLPLLMPYGNEHKKARQMLHKFFAPTAVADFHELQTQVARQLLWGLVNETGSFRDLTRRAAGELIMMVAYGYKVSDANDPYVELADKSIRAAAESERNYLVNILPWLRYLPEWFPGTGFHQFIKESVKLSRATLYDAHEMSKKNFFAGTAIPSMTSRLLEENLTEDGKIANEDTIVNSTSVAYIAGADTTVSTLNTFCLAMLLRPEVQRRAQDELDRVVGKDTLPTMEDKPNLPYIMAICKECMRWQSVTPLAAPHCAAEDDVYNGYFIPAGTTVFANVWGMQRDPKEYPEPEKFIPERWLPCDGKQPPLDVFKTAFGFGRRFCSGRYFAENSIFISIASILAAFDITKAVDANGNLITPAVEYTASFARHPVPFECRLTPRSCKIAPAIYQAIEATE